MSKRVIMFPGQGSQKLGMGKTYFKKYYEIVTSASDICGFPIDELCTVGPIDKLNNSE